MKQLRNIVLLAGLLLGGHFTGLGQVFDWAKLAQNKGRNVGYGLGGTTDAAGNTYIAFGFQDSARVGGRLIRHPGNVYAGMQLASFDSTGRVRWVKATRHVYYSPDAATNSFQADPVNGGFFVTGSFYLGATWDGSPIPAAAGLPASVSTGFYGKVAANGALLWTRPLPTNANFYPSLAVDGLGNCYLAGVNSTYQTPAVPLPGTVGGVPFDSTRAFVVGNNAAGTGEWVQLVYGTPFPSPVSRYDARYPAGLHQNLRVGPKLGGGCLLFGMYNQSLYYGRPGGAPVLASRTALNTFDDFIASINPGGSLGWVRPGRMGGTAASPVPTANAAAADQAGNYYVTGSTLSPTGTLSGFGAAKYSPTGAVLWATSQPQQGSTPNINAGKLLVLDTNGEVTIQANTEQGSTIGSLLLSDYQSLIHLDAAGVPRWVIAVRSAGDPQPQRNGSYIEAAGLGLDGRGNVYYISAPDSYSPVALSPLGGGIHPPTFLLGELTQVGAGVSVARIGTRHNTVQGRLYLDANGNGVRDGSEGPFPRNVPVQCIQATYAPLGTFDVTGSFNVYVGAGAYTLPAPAPPLHYALTQPAAGSYTGSFAGYGRVDTARHFGLAPIANQADIRATLTPYGAARPGFLTRYRLTVENVGTTTVASGTASVAFDARMAYVSSTPAATRSGQTLSWTYANLAPFARRDFDVLFSLPTNTPLGTALSSTGSAPLPADVLPADNTSTAAQTVTGSFDPNDITVNYQRLSPAQVAAGQPLDYTIRFQNMGTDTAFTVVIKDTLNFRKLNLGSLMLVAQSHNCVWSLSGQGELTVRFLNVRLPHRGVDVLRSQGFVRFRVLPRASLVAGDIIPNRAHIVFDYNAPVRTNLATTAVLLPTAALNARAALAWALYPNPTAGPLTIAAELPAAGPVAVRLLDALGRPVRQQTLLAPAGPLRQTLDVQALAPGLYVLRLTLPDGTASSRVVVRE